MKDKHSKMVDTYHHVFVKIHRIFTKNKPHYKLVMVAMNQWRFVCYRISVWCEVRVVKDVYNVCRDREV